MIIICICGARLEPTTEDGLQFRCAVCGVMYGVDLAVGWAKPEESPVRKDCSTYAARPECFSSLRYLCCPDYKRPGYELHRPEKGGDL